MTDTLKDYVRRQWERDKAQIEREAIDNYIASPEFRDALARVMHQTQIIGCIASDGWGRDCDGQCRDEADAIIAALKENK